jgi:hypothetical protein
MFAKDLQSLKPLPTSPNFNKTPTCCKLKNGLQPTKTNHCTKGPSSPEMRSSIYAVLLVLSGFTSLKDPDSKQQAVAQTAAQLLMGSRKKQLLNSFYWQC